MLYVVTVATLLADVTAIATPVAGVATVATLLWHVIWQLLLLSNLLINLERSLLVTFHY